MRSFFFDGSILVGFALLLLFAERRRRDIITRLVNRFASSGDRRFVDRTGEPVLLDERSPSRGYGDRWTTHRSLVPLVAVGFQLREPTRLRRAATPTLPASLLLEAVGRLACLACLDLVQQLWHAEPHPRPDCWATVAQARSSELRTPRMHAHRCSINRGTAKQQRLQWKVNSRDDHMQTCGQARVCCNCVAVHRV